MEKFIWPFKSHYLSDCVWTSKRSIAEGLRRKVGQSSEILLHTKGLSRNVVKESSRQNMGTSCNATECLWNIFISYTYAENLWVDRHFFF